MVRKKEVKIYTFDELSEKAKERAINNWRDSGNSWDSHDSTMISDMFKERLEEKGLDNPKVEWSLGYCQGDGVCFSGTFDMKKLFKENPELEKFKEYEPYVGAFVKHTSRNCHWNSMDVEVEMVNLGHHHELLPKEMFEKINDWEIEASRRSRRWTEEIHEIRMDREAPIREWERRVADAKLKPGMFEWFPDIGTKPDPLNIPLPPPFVHEPMPEELAKSDAWAKAEYERLENGLSDLQEALGEWVEDMSRELEKNGYAEIEYRDSDELISDILIANEYEFTEDGKRWKD